METYNVSKEICQILGTGSDGNAVLYHRSILVDIGLSYKSILPYKNDLQIILLTHIHGDHLNISALKKLCFERPTLRVACGSWMVQYLEGIKNIDVLEPGKIYNYGAFKISPIVLYHDVKNYGYRILKDNHKTIHITDTSHVEGISAKEYDLYAIEFNYDNDTIHDSIARIESRGGYAYQKGAINSHLSKQQAKDFIFKNKGEHSKIIRLHESRNT